MIGEHPLAQLFAGPVSVTVTVPVTICVNVVPEAPDSINEYTERDVAHRARDAALREITSKLDALHATAPMILSSSMHDACASFTYVKLDATKRCMEYIPKPGDDVVVVFEPEAEGAHGILGTITTLHEEESAAVVRFTCGVTVNGTRRQEHRFAAVPLLFIKPLENPCP